MTKEANFFACDCMEKNLFLGIKFSTMAKKSASAPSTIQNNNANDFNHYKLMTVGIVIGLAGVFGRFVQDSTLASGIANVLVLIGSVICIKAVLNILK
ncbi:MAG: hypothetical protein RLZ47_869 [Bacteroidota bacterium]|jgi:hypothetical protein